MTYPTKDRITITLTTITRKRLIHACKLEEAIVGSKVAPTRVMNQLILNHLPPHPDEQEATPTKRKTAHLARSA